jgi:hypothetical protein
VEGKNHGYKILRSLHFNMHMSFLDLSNPAS